MTASRRNKVASSPRHGTAHARLTSALALLTNPTEHTLPRATVSELCRLANVSRNSLYRYHAPILAALRQHQRPSSVQAKALHSAELHRRDNIDLHERLAKLAALADHYFAAYRETAALLERRERELAELRGKLTSRPTVLHSVFTEDRARS
jgi:AcrR family transcriptional regulator